MGFVCCFKERMSPWKKYCVGRIMVTVFLVQYIIIAVYKIVFLSFRLKKVGFVHVFVKFLNRFFFFPPFCLITPNVVVLYIKKAIK